VSVPNIPAGCGSVADDNGKIATLWIGNTWLGRRYGHFTSGGIDDRIESTLPPVFSPKMVPRS
jgi:hypothetical protein